jgi:hypothetical protein
LVRSAWWALASPSPLLTARCRRWTGPKLGQGPYSAMHMRLQKTILNINVADIDVKFDKATQAKMRELARGKPYSDGLAHQISLLTLDAKHAVFLMKFLRDIRSIAGSAW